MNKLIHKELKLAASPLTYFFVMFGLMTMIPGYPILVGAFFVCFGIFHSFQSARESNDILYSALLPIKKSDVVTAKYLFSITFQMLGFLIMTVLTVIRMVFLSGVEPYLSNPLLSANLTFLTFTLLVYSCFNLIFINGFFKTAVYFGKPFITFIIVAFLLIGLAETLHHIPGLELLNTSSGSGLYVQGILFVGAVIVYIVVTIISMNCSKKRFERIDL